MAQVTARGQVQAEHAVARPHQREEHGEVGLAAGVRLYVRVGAPEQLARAVHGGLLNHVHEAPAGVVAGAWVSFERLVRHFMAERLEGRRG